MLLTLVDALRCPAHNEESSLVLSVEEWAGPRVGEGVLGCPACNARYRIHRGTVDFAPGGDTARQSEQTVDPLRLAAQLELTEPGGIVLLTGAYAGVHEQLSQFADATWVLLGAEPTLSLTAVNFRVGSRLPFADRALRGAAVDGSDATDVFIADVSRCLRHGGRLVMPSWGRFPAGMTEIARDARELLGEASAATHPVPIHRSRPNSDL